MKINPLIYLLIIFLHCGVNAQDREQLKKELAEQACICIEKIDKNYQSKDIMLKDVSSCIEKQTSAYQLGAKFMDVQIDSLNQKKDSITIDIDVNKTSRDFKKYYYELEEYLFENCEALDILVKSDETKRQNSVSKNPKALMWFDKGVKAAKEENYDKAIDSYLKAIEIDEYFAFAWDNLGLAYRYKGELGNAIKAYKKSLEIDPKGKVPLQNLAITYVYKEKYKKAIKTFEKIAEYYPGDPEIFYGIGQIYYEYLDEYEKGLDNICQAYKIYVKQNSPYRTDAEQIISLIYQKMKAQDNLDKFDSIMEKHQIEIE